MSCRFDPGSGYMTETFAGFGFFCLRDLRLPPSRNPAPSYGRLRRSVGDDGPSAGVRPTAPGTKPKPRRFWLFYFRGLACYLEWSAFRRAVERFLLHKTFTIAIWMGSRRCGRRDSSTAPSAPLGMTEQCTIHNYSVSVTLSGGRSPKSKGLNFPEHSPSRFVRVYARSIVEILRLRSG